MLLMPTPENLQPPQNGPIALGEFRYIAENRMIQDPDHMFHILTNDIPRIAAGMLYQHILETQGESTIIENIAQYFALDMHVYENRLSSLAELMTQKAANGSEEWEGQEATQLQFLFPHARVSTARYPIKGLSISPVQVAAFDTPEEVISAFPRLTQNIVTPHLILASAIAQHKFIVRDWKRKRPSDEPLTGSILHPFVIAVSLSKKGYLEEHIWGTHTRMWDPDSGHRLRLTQRELQSNQQLAALRAELDSAFLIDRRKSPWDRK